MQNILIAGEQKFIRSILNVFFLKKKLKDIIINKILFNKFNIKVFYSFK